MAHKLTNRIVVPTADGGSTRVTVADAILREIEATGLAATRCAHAGRVTSRLVAKWLADGARAAERAERGRPTLTPDDAALVRFHYDAVAAKSRWIAEQVKLHASVAAGGLTTAEVVETVDPTDRDARGQPRVVARRVKTARTLPDARAIEWALERQAKDEFAVRTELTGAGGGPIETESREDREERLVEALRAFKEGAELQARMAAERNGSEP